MAKICIDPGHGGEDSGAIGASNGLFESHAVLDIALQAAALLGGDHEVMLTRNNDTFHGLADRCRFANENNADIFVSIHLNSATNPEAAGHEVFTSGSLESRKLAQILSDCHAEKLPGQPNRGVKTNSFFVLNHTRMPAVLWEGCFLSNHEENDFISEPIAIEAMASIIADGITRYLNINKKGLSLEARVARLEDHLGLE